MPETEDAPASPLPHFLQRFRDFIEVLCFGLVISFVVIVAAAVVCRYVLNASLPWSEEFIRFSLFWCVMLGAIVITLDDQHLRIELLYDYVRPQTARFCMVFAHATIIIFCIVLMWSGMDLVSRSNANSPALGFPMWMVYMAMPVGGAGIAIASFWQIIRTLRGGPQ